MKPINRFLLLQMNDMKMQLFLLQDDDKIINFESFILEINLTCNTASVNY